MPNEVKLLPCPELVEAITRTKKRIERYETGLRVKAFEIGDNPISDEHAADLRVILAAVEATRPTIVTDDEVVERVAKLVAADQLKRRYGPGWDRLTKYGRAHLKHDVRTVLAAMPAIVGGEGWGEKRVCSVCTAVISQYPEGMCCHCQEMPWPLAQPDTPHD